MSREGAATPGEAAEIISVVRCRRNGYPQRTAGKAWQIDWLVCSSLLQGEKAIRTAARIGIGTGGEERRPDDLQLTTR